MVQITGKTCSFREARGKRPAHIFALCDLGQDHLLPVSLPGHQSARILHPPIEGGAGARYALLASLALTAHGWSVGRFNPPELFADKQALSVVHPVPDWWVRLTG